MSLNYTTGFLNNNINVFYRPLHLIVIRDMDGPFRNEMEVCFGLRR